MNPITDIWRQLVRRRLWPVALLLIAGLAAVPLVLASDPESAPPAPAPVLNAADTKAALAAEPIVALAGLEDADADRRPLGKRHDPFKPSKRAPKANKAQDEQSGAPAGTTLPASDQPADAGGSGSGSGSGDTGIGTGATPPAPQPETPQPKTYPPNSLLVKFDDGGETAKRHLAPRTALPSTEAPLIIYVGLSDDHRRAVFMLDSTVTAQGDGECHPSPESCETVQMRAGDTEFFDVVDESGEASGGFQLDLIKIEKGQTTSAARSTKLAPVAQASSVGSVLRSGLGGERRLGLVTRTG